MYIELSQDRVWDIIINEADVIIEYSVQLGEYHNELLHIIGPAINKGPTWSHLFF